MEAKPLRVVPSSDDRAGGGAQKKIDRGWTMDYVKEKRHLVKEEASAIKLGLGVGAYSAAINSVIAREKPLFTEAQRRELEHQAFIFKHFAYNLPVPQYLVLPILQSAVGTSESGFGGFCKQFPSFSGFSHQGFVDYGNMVETDPDRCRRTDGKKWRCRDKVLPDQKYCERHMHRGRHRSRKPVETSEVKSSFITKPSGNLHAKGSSNTESAVPVPNPLGIQLINTSSFTQSSGPCTLDSLFTNGCKNTSGSAGTQISFSPAAVAIPCSSSVTVAVPTVTTITSTTSSASNNRSNHNFCKKDDNAKSCISHKNIGVRSSGRGNIINDSNISTGIGFSPRSVLQGITVSGCHHSCLNDRNCTELEPEPGRCRRTDGKKWRCRSAVLPDQKYCATHMHRGAKKRFADHEPAAIPLSSAVTVARLPSPAPTPNIQKAYYTIPNTNLSMSIPASAPLIQHNEKSPSSSDTDTTISDTMIEYSYVSFSEAVSNLEPVQG